MNIQKRVGLIIYLYYNRDAKRLAKIGDFHYHSRRGKYVLIYVNAEEVAKKISFLKKQNYIKSLSVSSLDTINSDFVGNLSRDDSILPISDTE